MSDEYMAGDVTEGTVQEGQVLPQLEKEDMGEEKGFFATAIDKAVDAIGSYVQEHVTPHQAERAEEYVTRLARAVEDEETAYTVDDFKQDMHVAYSGGDVDPLGGGLLSVEPVHADAVDDTYVEAWMKGVEDVQYRGPDPFDSGLAEAGRVLERNVRKAADNRAVAYGLAAVFAMGGAVAAEDVFGDGEGTAAITDALQDVTEDDIQILLSDLAPVQDAAAQEVVNHDENTVYHGDNGFTIYDNGTFIGPAGDVQPVDAETQTPVTEERVNTGNHKSYDFIVDPPADKDARYDITVEYDRQVSENLGDIHPALPRVCGAELHMQLVDSEGNNEITINSDCKDGLGAEKLIDPGSYELHLWTSDRSVAPTDFSVEIDVEYF